MPCMRKKKKAGDDVIRMPLGVLAGAVGKCQETPALVLEVPQKN